MPDSNCAPALLTSWRSRMRPSCRQAMIDRQELVSLSTSRKCKRLFSLLGDPITLASSSWRGAPRALLRRRNGYSSPFARDTIFTGVGVGTFLRARRILERCFMLYISFGRRSPLRFHLYFCFSIGPRARPLPYLLHFRKKLSLRYTPSFPLSLTVPVATANPRRTKPPTCGQAPQTGTRAAPRVLQPLQLAVHVYPPLQAMSCSPDGRSELHARVPLPLASLSAGAHIPVVKKHA